MSTKFKEQKISISVQRKYAKPYAQKIKQIIWNRLDSVCEVEDNSFDADEEVEMTLYFLATDEQMQKLLKMIVVNFDRSFLLDFSGSSDD